MRRGAARHARLHRLHPDRDLPPRFQRDGRRPPRWRRDGDVLEFWIEADAFMRHMNRVLVGTMLEVAGGRRSVEDFARLLRAARAPRRARPRRRTGSTSRALEYAASPGRADRHASPRSRAAGPAHQRRRHRGRGPAGAAPRAARGRRRRARRHRAGLQPLGDRPRDHHPAPAVGPGGRLRRRHRRLRDRRHAGRLRALRHARADRGLRGRPDRLRHQPRLQPRRRHHLLRHRRRRARGRRARAARRSPSRSSRSRARWTSGSASASTSTPPPRSSARDGRGDRRRPAARTARCSTSTSRPATSPASRSRGSASASTATSSCSQDEESGRRQYRIYGDAPGLRAQEGTDLAAVAAGRIAVTPMHFDLTDEPGIETLQAYDLARLLAPAADELE